MLHGVSVVNQAVRYQRINNIKFYSSLVRSGARRVKFSRYYTGCKLENVECNEVIKIIILYIYISEHLHTI